MGQNNSQISQNSNAGNQFNRSSSDSGYNGDPFANDGKPIDISDDDLPF